jgi:Alternative complex III, ActD subunit
VNATARQAAVYGLMAEFDRPEDLLEATRHAYDRGYRMMDAYTPFPIDGLAEALGFERNRIALVVLVGGLLGGIGGFFMQWFSAVIHFPLDIGGRPLNSWPSFIPITFELAILVASLAAVLGMLGLNGLPRPHHPVFNLPSFALASRNRFFLCLQARDPLFDVEGTRVFLEGYRPRAISVVPV